MAETVNEAERRGIDRKAAISFLTGHFYNLTANFLGLLNARVSDACLVAIGLGNRLVLRDELMDPRMPSFRTRSSSTC